MSELLQAARQVQLDLEILLLDWRQRRPGPDPVRLEMNRHCMALRRALEAGEDDLFQQGGGSRKNGAARRTFRT